MSSTSNDGKTEPSTSKQIALTETAPNVSTRKNVGEVGLLPQTADLQGLEPPKPAVRHRAQQSVQVARSVSVSGVTVSQQQHNKQRFSQQVQTSASGSIDRGNLFNVQRPLSVGSSNFTATSDISQQASSSFAQTTGTSGHLVAAKRTVNQASSHSSTSGVISTSNQASATQYTSASQSTSSSNQQSSKATTTTTTERTVASRTLVSSSSTRFSSGSISGEALSADAAKALLDRASVSSTQQTGTTTTTQKTFASRTVSATSRISSSSTTSAGAIGSTSISQQLEGSSIQFGQSTSASTVSQSVVVTGNPTRGKSTLSPVPLPPYLNPSSSSNITTSSKTTSSLASQSASSTTTNLATASRLSLTDSIRSRSADKSERESQLIQSLGKTSSARTSMIGDEVKPINTSEVRSASERSIWTTSPAERDIASKYLDKSFKSTAASYNLESIKASESGEKKLNEGSIKNKLQVQGTTMVSKPAGVQLETSSSAQNELVKSPGPTPLSTTSKLAIVTGLANGDSIEVKEEFTNVAKKSTGLVEGPIELKSFVESDPAKAINDKHIKSKVNRGSDTLKPGVVEEQVVGSVKAEIRATKGASSGRNGAKESIHSESEPASSKLAQSGPLGSSARDDQTKIPIISATTPNSNYSAISTSAKNSTYLPLPSDMPPQRSYPKKVFFIIVNEFCERFSYYGLRAILVLYLRNALYFSESDSTVAFHLFTALCYLTPVIGAILADSVWGKFKTILYLSIVYFFGEFVLVLSSVFWNSGGFSVAALTVGLVLIGFGTGGIKPCVGALGGDQFYPHETHWRQTFFSIFYASINLGALLSMFLTPLLRSNFQCVDRTDCYPYAYGLPCILMFISIIVFTVAKNRYYIVPLPEKNVLIAFCKCVWLAGKRKLSGDKIPEASTNMSNNPKHSLDIDTSSSNLSVSSSEEAPVHKTSFKKLPPSELLNAEKMLSYQQGSKGLMLDSGQSSLQVDRNHWLYLASDRCDTKSIEDFRSVLGALFLMLPMPVYWALFDQQGSLWTLQATRMNGRVLGSDYVIEPDQMSVLNPLLLLTAIPVFEVVIYPLFKRCNVLTTSIQRITTGGVLVALAFVASALIELHIQHHLPPISPYPGQANLLLVNGLGDCSLSNPKISYIQLPINDTLIYSNSTLKPIVLDHMEPLSTKGLAIISATNSSPISHYQITFKLTNIHFEPLNLSKSSLQLPTSGCPFGQDMFHEMAIKPLPDKAVKLLYLEQGNGKVAYRIFDDSLTLPPSGKARVRLLYEFFGSATLAHTRQFYLHRSSMSDSISDDSHPNANLKFHTMTRDGQVLMSQFMDIDIKTKGETLYLRTNDKLIGNSSLHPIHLEEGTRNLIMVHQSNATDANVKHQLLQSNDYRVSILYQLVPYLLLSMSEVLFCITSLDFSYSMAPKNMKTVLLAAYYLTVTFGNLLTVAIESLNLFPNLVYDFFFYALIMVLDMAIFAIMGYYHTPRRLTDE